MKRKFSHEEIVVTSVFVICSSSFFYCFAMLIYNAFTYGISMNI